MKKVLGRVVAGLESLVKRVLFDCHSCGQCVLKKTGLICPMSCPKGLRNGPCGGTINGNCEVKPDEPCVWIRIHERTAQNSLTLPMLLPSPDAQLSHTSSYVNYLTGADQYGRTPLKYLDLGTNRTRQPLQTLSQLEQRLKAGAFVCTTEVRAPRIARLEKLREQALQARGAFDAVNVTAYLHGKPTLPSAVGASEVASLGIDAICQSTCRDHTRTSFVAELLQNQVNGVHNVLCLTGDSYKGGPKPKQVFDMDAALMLYEARYLRETGTVLGTGDRLSSPPRLFLGAAINPFSTPVNIPVRRLKQKVAAGADFIQTQMIFDVPAFGRFMELVHQERIDDDVFILAGIPVVTSRKALSALRSIPGVEMPEEIFDRLAGAKDCVAEGVALAREIAFEVSSMPGVAGVHLMLFGAEHEILPAVLDGLKATRDDFQPPLRDTDLILPDLPPPLASLSPACS